jgi:hypothetical protein
MLTLKQIFKAARLMHQVGELRPGFLHKDSANIEGPCRPQYPRTKTTQKSKKKKLSIIVKKDPISGEKYFSMSE